MHGINFTNLIDALRCLPGVGPKSAVRIAYHLLQRDRKGAEKLASALHSALTQIQHCERCNTFSENIRCELCRSSKRDDSLLCIVEMPTDMIFIEQTQVYSGLYFVLMGRLSPLDGIIPQDIHLEKLLKRIKEESVKEIILATNYTVEGEATAYCIGEFLKNLPIKISRIARGIPSGGEIEYVDMGTLARAFIERIIL